MTATWNVQVLREALCILTTGDLDDQGRWYPDTDAVAGLFDVTRRTIERWIQGEPNDPPEIPATRLDDIRACLAPDTAIRDAERAERLQLNRIRERRRLGRGRGNLRGDYERLGWLEPHVIQVLSHPGAPLMRVSVNRQGTPATRARKQWPVGGLGWSLADTMVVGDKFIGDELAYLLLGDVDAWRVVLYDRPDLKGFTKGWLASAPRPTLVQLSDRLDDATRSDQRASATLI